jgi:hypothetical protein
MERLRNKTLLIGKEPGQGRLQVAIQGTNLLANIGYPGSVPASVSRCMPAQGMAHAKIVIDANGNMTVTNMKPQNVTYVNGNQIMSKRIDADSQIELGGERFSVSVQALLNAAKSIIPVQAPPNPVSQPQSQSQPQKEFSVKHLRTVWERYDEEITEIQERQRKQGISARIPMFFTMGGGAISSVSIALGWPEWVRFLCIGLTIVGLIVMVNAFMKSKNDTSIADRKRVMEEFQDNYICPNPECKKSLPQVSYKLLRRNYPCCPYCKSKFVD